MVHWLSLSIFTYNNSVHASTGLMLFYAEKAHHRKLSKCIRKVLANGSVPNISNARARAQRALEIGVV